MTTRNFCTTAEIGRELRSGAEVPRCHPGSRVSSSAGERDAHAAVDLALLLDSRHRRAADLACASDMGAPARLEVEALDRNQADAPGSHRRLDRHGLDQAR